MDAKTPPVKKGTIVRPVAWQRGISVLPLDAKRTALPPVGD